VQRRAGDNRHRGGDSRQQRQRSRPLAPGRRSFPRADVGRGCCRKRERTVSLVAPVRRRKRSTATRSRPVLGSSFSLLLRYRGAALMTHGRFLVSQQSNGAWTFGVFTPAGGRRLCLDALRCGTKERLRARLEKIPKYITRGPRIRGKNNSTTTTPEARGSRADGQWYQGPVRTATSPSSSHGSRHGRLWGYTGTVLAGNVGAL